MTDRIHTVDPFTEGMVAALRGEPVPVRAKRERAKVRRGTRVTRWVRRFAPVVAALTVFAGVYAVSADAPACPAAGCYADE